MVAQSFLSKTSFREAENAQFSIYRTKKAQRLADSGSAWLPHHQQEHSKCKEAVHLPPLNNIPHRSELADAVITDQGGPQRLLRVGAERIVFLGKLLDKADATSQCAVVQPPQKS